MGKFRNTIPNSSVSQGQRRIWYGIKYGVPQITLLIRAGLVASLILLAAFVSRLFLIALLLSGLVFAIRYLTTLGRTNAVSLTERRTRFALVLGASVFGLVILEIGARIVSPSNPVAPLGLYEPHPRRIFTHVPGAHIEQTFQVGENEVVHTTISISSLGLRDREYGPKHEGEFRILLLGDSMTYGHGLRIEQTLARSLEDRLRERWDDTEVYVINGGTQGYGPWQEADWLQEIGFLLEPDIVLLQLFFNDFNDTLEEIGKSRSARAWREKMQSFRLAGTWPNRAERLARNRSRAYAVFCRATEDRSWLAHGLRWVFSPNGQSAVPQIEPYDDDILGDFFQKTWPPYLDEAWSRLREDLLAIKRLCDARDTHLFAYTIPVCASVGCDDYWRDSIATNPNALYERGKDVRVFDDFFGANDIPTFSALDPLAALADPDDAYYLENGHLRPLGAATVAEAASTFLDARRGEF